MEAVRAASRRPRPRRPARYSALALLRHGVSGRDWPRAWPDHPLRGRYDVVIVGGGVHGLATAYYLAVNHGITDVAVLDKGYIGGGGSGRSTAILRSNYLTPEGVRFYDRSMQLYRTLAADLDYNVMFSRRAPDPGPQRLQRVRRDQLAGLHRPAALERGQQAAQVGAAQPGPEGVRDGPPEQVLQHLGFPALLADLELDLAAQAAHHRRAGRRSGPPAAPRRSARRGAPPRPRPTRRPRWRTGPTPRTGSPPRARPGPAG